MDDFGTAMKIGGTNVIGGLAGLADALTPGSNGVLADISGWANDKAGALQKDYSTQAQRERAQVQQDMAHEEAVWADLRKQEKAAGILEQDTINPTGKSIIAG